MFSTKEVLTTEMLFKNGKMKNISKSQVLTLKDEVAYQEGMVVSKTLVQNDAVSVTLFSFDKGESIVMPAGLPHAVYGKEQFKMLLVVVF